MMMMLTGVKPGLWKNVNDSSVCVICTPRVNLQLGCTRVVCVIYLSH